MIARLPKHLRQVFIRSALGWKERHIASDLGIGVSTAQAHRTALRHRLGIKAYDRAAVVRIASGPLFFR